MTGFVEEYLNEGASENYATPPKPGTNPTGPPYTNSSNYILRQTLTARDEAQALLAETQQIVSDINLGNLGVDVAGLPARP